MAKRVRSKIKEVIDKAKGEGAAFSFTTDIWSSRANDSYISLTAHFLVNFERQNIVLNVASFNGQHTAENISAKIGTLLQSWGFDEGDVFLVLRDNAANMRAGFRLSGLDSFGCLAHTFQVVRVSCDSCLIHLLL